MNEEERVQAVAAFCSDCPEENSCMLAYGKGCILQSQLEAPFGLGPRTWRMTRRDVQNLFLEEQGA